MWHASLLVVCSMASALVAIHVPHVGPLGARHEEGFAAQGQPQAHPGAGPPRDQLLGLLQRLHTSILEHWRTSSRPRLMGDAGLFSGPQDGPQAHQGARAPCARPAPALLGLSRRPACCRAPCCQADLLDELPVIACCFVPTQRQGLLRLCARGNTQQPRPVLARQQGKASRTFYRYAAGSGGLCSPPRLGMTSTLVANVCLAI